MSRAFSLAGFEVTLIGRFWVTTEDYRGNRVTIRQTHLDGCGLRCHLPARPNTACLASSSCSSARVFAPRFFQAPPRGECYFTLALAITSRPSRCEEDLYLQAVDHARHTNKAGVPIASGRPQCLYVK